ncbi:hypothetical protein BH10PLA2_BH10PLA2_19050 [soil metagenome]
MICHNLDSFLAEDLNEEDSRLFRAHLKDCLLCQSAVTQQRRLDRLLAEATQAFDIVPPTLAARIEHRLQRRQRRRLLAYACTVPVAASLVWILLHLWPRPEPLRPESGPPPQVAQQPTASPVQVSFANRSKHLVVPEDTGLPDVTFVWVLPNQRKSGATTE